MKKWMCLLLVALLTLSLPALAEEAEKPSAEGGSAAESPAEAGETASSEQEKAARIELLTEQMQQAARELEFEQAAKLRDEIKKLRGETVTASKKIRPGMVGSAKKSRGRSRK